jgi:hypothetical protein
VDRCVLSSDVVRGDLRSYTSGGWDLGNTQKTSVSSVIIVDGFSVHINKPILSTKFRIGETGIHRYRHLISETFDKQPL